MPIKLPVGCRACSHIILVMLSQHVAACPSSSIILGRMPGSDHYSSLVVVSQLCRIRFIGWQHPFHLTRPKKGTFGLT
ncbi:hypothetical protein BDW75DRAFT_218268 [Aspergillus navahoensis]